MPDTLAALLDAVHASKTDLARTTGNLADFKQSLRPLKLQPGPAPQPVEPELSPSGLAYDQAVKLARLMGGRSPVAYRRCQTEQQDVLIAETKELALHDGDVHYEIGQRLYVLKRRKPPGVSFSAYLKDLDMPWGVRRSEEYIREFLGMTTALERKEKNAARNRQYRARRPLRDARRAVDNKQENGSACAIDWENYKEDGQTDADARSNAVAWQLHEVERLAHEFALLRPGTKPREIRKATIRRVGAISAAWKRLQRELQKRSRG